MLLVSFQKKNLKLLVSFLAMLSSNWFVECIPPVAKRTGKNVDLIAFLCQKYDTSEDDLKTMLEKVNNLINVILKKECRPASEFETENLHNINTGQSVTLSFTALEIFSDSMVTNHCQILS